VPAAGSCVECPLRTGHNKLLFSELGKLDACTAPTCYQAKVDAHIAKTIAAKPKLVQISTAYGQHKEGSALPRNKYTEIRIEKPGTKEEAARPEFKTCKYTTEAIVSEGVDKGEMRKVCTEPTCPVHHSKPRAQKVADDGKWKAEQEKQRREAAIANTTGIRILAAISAAIPVRLMKRDLLFVVERLASMVDENRLTVLAKQHGIKQAKDSDSVGKLFAAYLRRVEESALGRVLVELTILHATGRQNVAQVLRDAAAVYKVDADAITLKVKQEFAAKEKAHTAKEPVAKPQAKAAKKVRAA
jgi:ParB family transcriptional regulator, chromosome partitioning protein